MKECCEIRRNIIGTYEGGIEASRIEAIEEDGLVKNLVLIGRTEHGDEDLHQCRHCGQYWLQIPREGGKGNLTYYQKSSAEEVLCKVPALKRPGCCKTRPDTIGRIDDGKAKFNASDIEDRKELGSIIKSLIRCWGGGYWPYQCNRCGQYWIRYTEQTGYESDAVYFKTTIEEIRQNFPESKFSYK